MLQHQSWNSKHPLLTTEGLHAPQKPVEAHQTTTQQHAHRMQNRTTSAFEAVKQGAARFTSSQGTLRRWYNVYTIQTLTRTQPIPIQDRFIMFAAMLQMAGPRMSVAKCRQARHQAAAQAPHICMHHSCIYCCGCSKPRSYIRKVTLSGQEPCTPLVKKQSADSGDWRQCALVTCQHAAGQPHFLPS